MVKSAVELLAKDKKFKDGVLAGMLLAKKLATEKKKNTTRGGKKIAITPLEKMPEGLRRKYLKTFEKTLEKLPQGLRQRYSEILKKLPQGVRESYPQLQGGFDFKKALGIAAGPLGWLWLAARHKSDKELKEVKKRLEKYEPPKETKKVNDDDDIAVDDFPMENDDVDDFDLDDFPMENDDLSMNPRKTKKVKGKKIDDFDLDDFE